MSEYFFPNYWKCEKHSKFVEYTKTGWSLHLACRRRKWQPTPVFLLLAWKIPWTEEPGELVRRVTKSDNRARGHQAELTPTYLTVTDYLLLCYKQDMSPPPLLKSDVCTLSCFSRVQLCDPVDHSRPGSSVHRDSPGKNTGWFAISSTRGSSQPGEWSCISCLLRWQAGSSPPAPSGKPFKSDTLTVTPVTGMIWQVSFFCFDINVLWQVIQIGHLSSPDFFICDIFSYEISQCSQEWTLNSECSKLYRIWFLKSVQASLKVTFNRKFCVVFFS